MTGKTSGKAIKERGQKRDELRIEGAPLNRLGETKFRERTMKGIHGHRCCSWTTFLHKSYCLKKIINRREKKT